MEQLASGWRLSEPEIDEGFATCPRCKSPTFIDRRDGVEMVICTCGFNAAISDIANLPRPWVDEALTEDLVEDAREYALMLADSEDPDWQLMGEDLLDVLDAGATDQVGLQRIKQKLIDDGGRHDEGLEAIGRLIRR